MSTIRRKHTGLNSLCFGKPIAYRHNWHFLFSAGFHRRNLFSSHPRLITLFILRILYPPFFQATNLLPISTLKSLRTSSIFIQNFSWILHIPSPLALSQYLFIHSLTSLIFLNTFYTTGTVLGSEQCNSEEPDKALSLSELTFWWAEQ